MQDYPQDELEARYQKLPQPLKDALFSPEVAYQIFDTGKKYGMSIEQIGEIADEVGYVILGVTRPSEFIANLKARIDTDEDTAREIASEINHTVFAGLRTLLRETHHVEMTDRELMPQAEDAQKSTVIPTPAPMPAPEPISKKPATPIAPAAPAPPTPPKPSVPPIPQPGVTKKSAEQANIPISKPQTTNEESELPSWVKKRIEKPSIPFEEEVEVPKPPAPKLPEKKPAIEAPAPGKPERSIPSWIREQEERKIVTQKQPEKPPAAPTTPPAGGPPTPTPAPIAPTKIPPLEKLKEEPPQAIPPVRFTLDLRNKKPPERPAAEPPKVPAINPKIPAIPNPTIQNKEMPQMQTQKSVPLEIETLLKDMKETNIPVAGKPTAPSPIEATPPVTAHPASPPPALKIEPPKPSPALSSQKTEIEPPKFSQIPQAKPITQPNPAENPPKNNSLYDEKKKNDPYREPLE